MASSSVPDAPTFSVRRRKSQVFVEIPPSPLLAKSRVIPQPSKVDTLSSQHEDHKETTVPLSTKLSVYNIPVNAEVSGKRKLWDGNSIEKDANSKKTKIPKTDGDDLVICHQCRSKKVPDVVLQCTYNLKTTGKRCKASYCNKCLKTRYGETLEAINQQKLPQTRDGHDPNTSYHFRCPRCSDYCNCAPCRKRKGLAPVGKFILAKEGESVREILEKNPEASGFLPKNVAMPPMKPSKLAEAVCPTRAEKPKKDVDRQQKRTMKAAPEPLWKPLSQNVTRKEMEDRIYLREFILRFNPILDIGHRNVEELDDFTTLHDQSTKAVLISLLDLIAVEDDCQKKKIQETIKKIRGLGINWNKIGPLLYELRDSMPANHALRSLPMLEPAEAEVTYNIRGMRMQALNADQLLPVLVHLVEVVSVGESARQELEEGARQAKDIRSAYLKARREETERWITERVDLVEEKQQVKKKVAVMDAAKAKYRDAESNHKSIVFDIQNSYKPEMDGCSSRFMPLGTDMDGRIYYALSASGPRRGKKERVPGEGERFKKLGWFISVWGKSGTVVHNADVADDDDEEEETDPNAERWWRFADIEEIRKLSRWLAYRAETDMFGKKTDTMASTSANKIPLTTSATSTSSTLASGPSASARNTVFLEARSHLTLSNSGSETEMDIDGEGEGRVETDLSQPATRDGVKALAKSLLEFADFVEWRMKSGERSAK